MKEISTCRAGKNKVKFNNNHTSEVSVSHPALIKWGGEVGRAIKLDAGCSLTESAVTTGKRFLSSETSSSSDESSEGDPAEIGLI